MKTAIILAAGRGTRVWPYGEIRPKALLPVAGRPLVAATIDSLEAIGFERIVVAGGYLVEGLVAALRGRPAVQVLDVGATRGSALSLLAALRAVDDERFLVLHGDSLVAAADLGRLVEAARADRCPVALVAAMADENPRDWICCSTEGGLVREVRGHSRRPMPFRFAAFALDRSIVPSLEANSGIFEDVDVGAMPPAESYLEASLADTIRQGGDLSAVVAAGPFVDVDKPWHILEANEHLTAAICGALADNVLEAGASIDASARLRGPVRLGRGSRIGASVIVEGPVWVGDDTTIDNGAILQGNNVIGDRSRVANGCLLSRGATVGSGCVVDHCAELCGLIMDGVHLSHYMEVCGVVGTKSDLGAATVCGTLRFDDGGSTLVVKGRPERPARFSNCAYLGDYCRTGVNAILMPGCRVGVYGVVGAGVVLNEDLGNRTLVYAEQKLVRRPWGPERYGW